MRNCPICNNHSKLVIDFGEIYFTGQFKTKPFDQKKGDLKLLSCSDCYFWYMNDVYNQEELFSEYFYRSGTTLTMKNHFNYIIDLIKKYSTLDHISLLDIGCNDGTFLEILNKSYNSNTYFGIDPSPAIKENTSINDLNLYQDFYPSTKLINNKFDIITCLSVFYDFTNPQSIIKAIEDNLKDDGLCIIEVNYLSSLIENCNIDMIGHEHFAYYSLTSFKKLLNKSKLNLIDCHKNDMNGGNIVLIIKKNTSKESNYLIRNLNLENSKKNLKEKEFYNSYLKKINAIESYINQHLHNNKRMAFYGASTRGAMLVQLLKNINQENLVALDKQNNKHLKYLPGTQIKILQEDTIDKNKFDNFFVLPYQFYEEFYKKEKNWIEAGGILSTYINKIIENKN